MGFTVMPKGICAESGLAVSVLPSHCPSGSKGGNAGFWGLLDGSEWLLHIQRILWGGLRMVELLEQGDSIVTHCTDGWDRTAQLVSMTVLLLDPHYRTAKGLMQLIERGIFRIWPSSLPFI